VSSGPIELQRVPADAVAGLLRDGALLLTDTSAQAADWKRRLVMRASGAVCDTPAVSGWSPWLTTLARALPEMVVPLNRLQEQRLWEQVIGDHPASDQEQAQSSLRGLARHAADAYALMQDYQIDTAELYGGGNEAEVLATWIGATERRLAEPRFAGRILAARLPGELLAALPALSTLGMLPERILLAGFESFTPMQQQWFAALQAGGVTLGLIDAPAHAGRPPMLCRCSDSESEYRHVAARVGALLAEQPQARVAIAISDTVDSAALKRALGRALMPDGCLDPSAGMQPVVMQGERLSELPMIRALLQLLSIAGEFTLSFDDISALLLSPWLDGYRQERMQRAALEAQLRRQNRHRISYRSLLRSAGMQQLPRFVAVIEALAGWQTRRRPAAAWVKEVHELLSKSGFIDSGRHAGRSGSEIRQLNAFRDLLISLVSVDALGGVIAWSEMLSLLRSACSETRLPEAAACANVSLLPLNSINGLQFDAVCAVGMDDAALPLPARPHPMLPASVQKKHALPMSSGALAYAAAESCWQALLQSAPHIEISYAALRDGQPTSPSSFTAGLEPSAPEADIDGQAWIQPALEPFEDAAVPLDADESVRGGTAILRNQSACPFRAFAGHRLGIAGLEETAPGLDAGSKGSLIHLALERIWRELGSQARLIAMSDDELHEFVSLSTEYAMENSRMYIGDREREIERQRIQELLAQWLHLERKRPPFTVIDIEQACTLRLPEQGARSFDVHIKLDRIDLDSAGRRILIDYKTGAGQSRAKWLGERIEEPQLPQYAVAAGLGARDAVAFGRLRAGELGFEGLSAEALDIDGIAACDGRRGLPDDWQQLLADWRARINALAAEFVDGRCDVAPRNSAACNYCGLEALCRIDEIGFARAGEEDA